MEPSNQHHKTRFTPDFVQTIFIFIEIERKAEYYSIFLIHVGEEGEK